MTYQSFLGDSALVVPSEQWTTYRKVSGVYAIRHIDSRKVYIGSAVNLRTRWTNHRADLRGGRHTSLKLQRAWSKYGELAFEFILLGVCAKEQVVTLEQEWLDKTRAVDFGYNACRVAGSRLGMRFSDQTKAKMSATKLGKYRSPESTQKQAAQLRGRSISEQHKANISASNMGKKMSPEAIFKSASARKGQKRSVEAIAKTAAANTGKKRTEEQRAAMRRPRSAEVRAAISEGQRAASPVTPEMADEIRRRHSKRCLINGTKAMSIEFGVSDTTIRKILYGRAWT